MQVLCDLEASSIQLRTDFESHYAAAKLEHSKLKGDLTSHITNTRQDLDLMSSELTHKLASDVSQRNYEMSVYKVRPWAGLLWELQPLYWPAPFSKFIHHIQILHAFVFLLLQRCCSGLLPQQGRWRWLLSKAPSD